MLGIVALLSSFYLFAIFGFGLGLIIDFALGAGALLPGLSARSDGAGGLAIAGVVLGAIACAFSCLWLVDVLMLASRLRSF